ncbi:MAG: MaoC family dehydratase N-terminal domain-containing protein [Firmicutes bacterium]|nr:MaoC family dehydratase N-terminal domain-containing protein [Bacillota bacterium]
MKYEEVKEGDVFTSPKREITEDDINAFAELTGDNNEIHTSEEYAKETRFGTRIAHGLLVMGIANGMYVRMGIFRNSVMMEIKEWKLIRPVKLGDVIYLRLTIGPKRPTKRPGFGICEMKYEILNQDEDTAAEGTIARMVPLD